MACSSESRIRQPQLDASLNANRVGGAPTDAVGGFLEKDLESTRAAELDQAAERSLDVPC